MAGGGVGEAMLLGAAMGGGSSMLTGGDPLKGALVGGLTGAIGGGINNLAGVSNVAAAPSAFDAAAPVSLQAGPVGSGFETLRDMGLEGAGSNAASAPPLNPGGYGHPLESAAAPTPAMPTASPVSYMPGPGSVPTPSFTEGIANLAKDPTAYIKAHPYIAGASALTGAQYARRRPPELEKYQGPLSRFRFDPDKYRRSWASGGIADLNTGGYNRVIGKPQSYQPMTRGGISDLGTYSDGGRMLRGRGDGMSDSIPGVIAGRRPARLADGEFVVPADVVSHLGNGSTDAGAKQLYSMMDRVRQARTGRRAQGRQINPAQFMPRRA